MAKGKIPPPGPCQPVRHSSYLSWSSSTRLPMMMPLMFYGESDGANPRDLGDPFISPQLSPPSTSRHSLVWRAVNIRGE